MYLYFFKQELIGQSSYVLGLNQLLSKMKKTSAV